MMFKDWVFPAYVRAMGPRKKPKKRRLTDRGQLVLTGALLTAALGLNTETSYVYQMFALLFCVAIGSRITLRLSRPRVAVKRILPKYATAEQTFTYRIRVENLGDNPEQDLVITDQPVTRLPDRQQYTTTLEPNEESRNAYDRFIGFHRFIYLQRQNTGITIKPARVDEVAVKAHRDVDVEATPLRRGVVAFRETQVMHQDPLALNFGLSHFANTESLLVLPKRYQLNPNWRLSGGRNFQPGGVTAAWSIGESDEFVSLRDYRDGDSMRKIHWPSTSKSTARMQKPVVKEYQDEFFARNALLLDLSQQNPRILEETIAVASSFALELQNADSMLDLIFLTDDGPRIITAGRGTSAVNEQLEALATVQQCHLPFSELSNLVLTHCRLVTGCIGVYADWTDNHESLSNRILGEGVALKSLVISETELPHGPYANIKTQSLQADLLKA